MGVRRFEDLDVWRLSVELKREVYALVARTTAARDFRFRDQIKESAASAPSAVAEGFGRYHHGEFAYLVGVAKASLNETKNHLYDGVDRGHWTARDANPLLTLANRAIGAATCLLNYLNRHDAPGQPRRHR